MTRCCTVWSRFGLMIFALGSAWAQNYPEKPIRVITPLATGATDLSSRILAEAAATGLGQRLVVDNRGIVGVELVAKAPPDGYTLLHYTSPVWLMPLLRRNVPWDVLRDFAPVSATVNTPNVIVVHPSLPVKSVKELIALARARPGALNYGSSSTGTGNHLAAELFKSMAKVDIVRIAYKGGGAATIDLVAGQLHLIFATAGSVTGHIQAGKLRALAVTSVKPSALVPGLPTVASSGLPGYEYSSLTGMFAPVKTPPAIIARLNREVVQTLNRPEVKERLFSSGVEVLATSPEEFTAIIKSEVARMSKVIEEAGIRENCDSPDKPNFKRQAKPC